MKYLKVFLGLVITFLLVAVIAVVVIINPFGASPLNNYTKDGNLPLPGLKQPVTVQRDEKGMAYIYARNLEDLYIAQGYTAAQDRLFQMELTRLFASGRIAELAGDKAKSLDVRMRTWAFTAMQKNMLICSAVKPGPFCRIMWTASTPLSKPGRMKFIWNSSWPE